MSRIEIRELVLEFRIINSKSWERKLLRLNYDVQAGTLPLEEIAKLRILRDSYRQLDEYLSAVNLNFSPDEKLRLERFLSHTQRIIKSVNLASTDQFKEYWYPLAQQDSLKKALILFREFEAPHNEHGYTYIEFAKKMHTTAEEVLSTLLAGLILPQNIFFDGTHRYIKHEYAEKCLQHKKECFPLEKLIPVGRFPVEDYAEKLKSHIKCRKCSQFYVKFPYFWWILKKDRYVTEKLLPQIMLELEKGNLQYRVRQYNGKAYADILDYIESVSYQTNFSLNLTKHLDNLFYLLEQNREKMQLVYILDRPCFLLEQKEFSITWLDLYLKTYRKSNEECFSCLIPLMRKRFPKTAQCIEKLNRIDSSIIRTIKTLLLYAPDDLPKLSYDEIESLNHVFEGFPLTDGNLFSEIRKILLLDRNIDNVCQIHPTYKSGVRAVRSSTYDAYTKKQFSIMAYCIFCEHYIREQNMVEKACVNKRYAEMWLYLSMHFICALRNSDLKKLPIISLQRDPNQTIDSIRNDLFTEYEYVDFIERFEFELSCLPRMPQKTKKHLAPNIVLHIPQSLKAHFGKLYMLVLAHREISSFESSEPLFHPENFVNRDYRNFLGPLFVQQFSGRSFSNRSANKSYLQGILETGNAMDSNSIKVEGYVLASVARSHKWNYGEFASTTVDYLQDGNFLSLKPEFFLHQLFERGVLSFIPHLMLQILYGEEYTSLPISKQTEIIQNTNLEVDEIETTFQIYHSSLIRARQELTDFLTQQPKETVYDALIELSHGRAPSHGLHSQCLLTALRRPCFQPDKHCIGCIYEIHMRADLYVLVEQFRKISKARKEALEKGYMEEAKQKKLILDRLMPSIAAILSYLKQYDTKMFQWAKGALLHDSNPT